MRAIVKALAICAGVLVPSAALAQAVIAGSVKDSSGAVLPGVAVEAAYQRHTDARCFLFERGLIRLGRGALGARLIERSLGLGD